MSDRLKGLVNTYLNNALCEIANSHADAKTKKLVESIVKETADFMAAYSDEISRIAQGNH